MVACKGGWWRKGGTSPASALPRRSLKRAGRARAAGFLLRPVIYHVSRRPGTHQEPRSHMHGQWRTPSTRSIIHKNFGTCSVTAFELYFLLFNPLLSKRFGILSTHLLPISRSICFTHIYIKSVTHRFFLNFSTL